VVVRRGRLGRVCDRVAHQAASVARSTSPLETHAWERISGKNPSVQIRGESAATARSSCSRLRLTLRGACGNQPSHRLSGSQFSGSVRSFVCRLTSSLCAGAARQCGFGRGRHASEPGPEGIHWCATEQQAGREARLVIVRLTIRVLLQVKFLSGPRTQNSPDLAAVDRALV